ncbi:unnamed protein product [Polarella glacialis]|uniref:Uncharacterized protein n=1 Tax=Polarella glacialis TaxID=89957 RepID=A0A813GFE2_POLGL|nr:unnamed protein product [Polarella glacialis]
MYDSTQKGSSQRRGKAGLCQATDNESLQFASASYCIFGQKSVRCSTKQGATARNAGLKARTLGFSLSSSRPGLGAEASQYLETHPEPPPEEAEPAEPPPPVEGDERELESGLKLVLRPNDVGKIWAQSDYASQSQLLTELLGLEVAHPAEARRDIVCDFHLFNLMHAKTLCLTQRQGAVFGTIMALVLDMMAGWPMHAESEEGSELPDVPPLRERTFDETALHAEPQSRIFVDRHSSSLACTTTCSSLFVEALGSGSNSSSVRFLEYDRDRSDDQAAVGSVFETDVCRALAFLLLRCFQQYERLLLQHSVNAPPSRCSLRHSSEDAL